MVMLSDDKSGNATSRYKGGLKPAGWKLVSGWDRLLSSRAAGEGTASAWSRYYDSFGRRPGESRDPAFRCASINGLSVAMSIKEATAELPRFARVTFFVAKKVTKENSLVPRLTCRR